MLTDSSTRLNKYISESGICSRREADRFIEQGNVFINGKRAAIGDQVKPGDVVKIKDIEIHALDAFDRTALITLPADQKAAGVLPDGMDQRAVNYLFKTPGGNQIGRAHV